MANQLYIREGRRMLGDYVTTEHDCTGNHRCNDPVGVGSYTMDSHNCQRLIVDGMLRNEGDVQIPLARPYGISRRAILPPTGAWPNPVAPVAISASHIAFGLARMEPVFMVLGESAAVIAAIAMDTACDVQDVDYQKTRAVLEERGQILETDVANVETANPSADET